MINKFQNLINDVFLTRRIQNFVINHPDDLDEYTQVTTDSEVVDGIAHSISDWEWENLSYREVKVWVYTFWHGISIHTRKCIPLNSHTRQPGFQVGFFFTLLCETINKKNTEKSRENQRNYT